MLTALMVLAFVCLRMAAAGDSFAPFTSAISENPAAVRSIGPKPGERRNRGPVSAKRVEHRRCSHPARGARSS